MDEIEKGYISLMAAIIEQAVTDYKQALKECDGRTIRECERFFLSEWGQALTWDNGENIMQRCRREVAEEKKKKE